MSNFHFICYLIVPQLIQLNYTRLLVWGSLARDYLSIMASSVSSERAFSSAGITLSKRRNRLQGDTVEALQFLKCLFHRDLIFREVRTFVEEELILEEGLQECDNAGAKDGESWEDLWIDADDIAESDTDAV